MHWIQACGRSFLLCLISECCSMVLEHCKTISCKRLYGKGLKKPRLERKTKREESLGESYSESDCKEKEGRGLMVDGNESSRVGEQGSVCEVSELTRMEGTDQASRRDTNQHLLIASGVPVERSICGEGKRRGVGGPKDNRSRHSSKNTKECHIIRRLSVSLQATQGNEPRWRRGFYVRLGSAVDSEWMLRHSFPKCMY